MYGTTLMPSLLASHPELLLYIVEGNNIGNILSRYVLSKHNGNILSLNNVQEKFRVTYDSKSGSHFVVHLHNGTLRHFKPTVKDLYVSPVVVSKNVPKPIAESMINTVDENEAAFKKR